MDWGMGMAENWLRKDCHYCPFVMAARSLSSPGRKNGVGTGGQRRLSSVVEELIAARAGTGHREKYVNGLRQYLALFARAHDAITIDCVTPAHIDRWFASRCEAPTTRASNLGRLSALFSFARRRGYCAANPCDNVERVRIERGTPKILSVEESRRLLETCRKLTPAILPAVVLGLFAGVRPHEVERMTWSDIDLDERRATVSAAASKVRRRRIVPLAPNSLSCSPQPGRYRYRQ